MRGKSDLVFVEHVIESIDAIDEFSKNLDKEKFAGSRLRRNAIIREIEIIGEAVKNISEGVKEKYKSVPWREIVGTRDKIIHHYFGIDLGVVWNIIKRDLPELREVMVEIRDGLEK